MFLKSSKNTKVPHEISILMDRFEDMYYYGSGVLNLQRQVEDHDLLYFGNDEDYLLAFITTECENMVVHKEYVSCLYGGLLVSVSLKQQSLDFLDKLGLNYPRFKKNFVEEDKILFKFTVMYKMVLWRDKDVEDLVYLNNLYIAANPNKCIYTNDFGLRFLDEDRSPIPITEAEDCFIVATDVMGYGLASYHYDQAEVLKHTDWGKEQDRQREELLELANTIGGEREAFHVNEIPNLLKKGYTCLTEGSGRLDHQTRYGKVFVNHKTKNFIIDDYGNISDFPEFISLSKEDDERMYSKELPTYMELKRQGYKPYQF